MEKQSIRLSFANNRVLAELYGDADKHLHTIEQNLGVTISSRGEVVSLSGAPKQVAIAKAILRKMYERLDKGQHVTEMDVELLITNAGGSQAVVETEQVGAEKQPFARKKSQNDNKEVGFFKGTTIKTPKKQIKPYSKEQSEYMEALIKNELTFGIGPAGTGKTYLAVAAAVELFCEEAVDRIILSRPAVEAGEQLGFLPGDMKDKVDPYLQPLYDALYEMLTPERAKRLIEHGDIEIAPLAFMRGRTLKNAYVILDEAQNTTPMQMKMFLTRLGEGTQMAVTGDLSQVDLPNGVTSGLRDATDKLTAVEGIEVHAFESRHVVRHPLTAKIVDAYDEAENA